MADMIKSFAEDLRSVREEKNITLKTISHQTRLNVTILENLESGDFTFQPQPYIRAFLKQYIASLGLDVDETLFDYDLARSNKYKSKRMNIQPPEEIIKKNSTVETVENEIKNSAKHPEVTEPPKTISEEKKESQTLVEKIQDFSKSTATKPVSEKPTLVTTSQNPSGVKKSEYSAPVRRRNYIASVMNSPVARNIVFILFIVLVLLGIYSIINILFLEGNKDKPEIIRQNFDEVVKEQEKKIFGKRTPEEIQDSIRKAENQLASSKDSITLKITALNKGVLFLVIDSINYNKPAKIEFEKNQFGVFKAKKFFNISSANTETFKATINDIPVKFDKSSVSKVKINKNGIVKQN